MTSAVSTAESSRTPAILGAFSTDVALLFLPGALTLALFWFVPPTMTSILVASFVTLYMLDSGHGYVTAMRIHLRPKALKSHSRALQLAYWLTPLGAFLLAAGWVYSGLPGLWTALVYVTLFHHLRQLYGVLRWYQKLNGRFDQSSHRFLYGLMLIPICVLHGRSDSPIRGLFDDDFLLFQSQSVMTALVVLHGIVAFVWIGFEIRTWRSGYRELNRLMAIGFPAGLSAFCVYFGDSVGQIVFPFLVLHAVAYFALVGLSLERTATQRSISWPFAALLAVALAAACGMFEWYYERELMVWNYERLAERFWPALVIGAYVTVPLSHYILDALIWRGDHPEARQVFTPS
ncbi:MAG: hypothetical protein AAFQ82_04400 [Myxococcota bacterium]